MTLPGSPGFGELNATSHINKAVCEINITYLPKTAKIIRRFVSGTLTLDHGVALLDVDDGRRAGLADRLERRRRLVDEVLDVGDGGTPDLGGGSAAPLRW